MADTSNLTSFLGDIANAIRTKKETTEQIPAEQFDQEILSIETGTNISDATAMQSEILEGKTAYIADGKVTGTMPNNGELNYTPSDNAQTIPVGYTSGGTINAADITVLNDYETCLALAKTILGDIKTNPISKGLLLSLECKQNNISDTSTGVICIDGVTSKSITVSNAIINQDYSIRFNGSSTEFNSGIAQSSLTNGYTIIVRIKPEEWKNYRGVYGLHTGSNGIVGFQYGDGAISCGHIGGSGSLSASTAQIPINAWSTVAVTYDGASYAQMYVNGDLISATESIGSIIANGNLIFGKAFNDTNRFFKGDISHCLVYNRALAKSEIQAVTSYIYNSAIDSSSSYLTSSGTQYINTGIVPTNNTAIEMSFNLLSYNSWNAIFGTRNSNSDNFYIWFNSSGTSYLGCGNSDILSAFYTMPLGKHTIYMKSGFVNIDGTHYGFANGTIDTAMPITLFKSNYSGEPSTCSNISLYYCKIYNSDILVRDFVPALDNNNVACLYDKVTKTFFYNSGTGDFVIGGVE